MARQKTVQPTTSLPLFLTAVLAAMIAVRLLFLGEPAGRDEAGFLLVGSGWDHGTSLYGSYWVDRPPLLIWIMRLAGDVATLRLAGLAACVLMVLGVARTAYLAAGDRAARWAGAAAALFSTAHWFGVSRTSGEMLASAFVAWGFALAAQALLRPGRLSWLHAAGAGLLGAGALLVEQTVADGLVFALALAVAVGWQKPTLRQHAIRVVATAAAGVVGGVGAGVFAATMRGTTVTGLFDALVTFRGQAGEVIRTSASDATSDRLVVLLATWAASGLALVAILAVWHGARRREPVLLAAVAGIGFVSAAAILGGDYWAHYLFQLVPASALATGIVAERVRPGLRHRLAALVVIAACANLLWTFVSPPTQAATAQTVGRWLRQSGQPSDTAVIAYGQPNVLTAAGMTSPYPYLWSLPVRTLDPDLELLTGVLSGPGRPTWFVDWSGPRSWGIDATALRTVLERDYREVGTVCDRTIWLDRSRPRSLAQPGSCP